MKFWRSAAAVLCAGMLLLTGCGNTGKNVLPVTKGFSCQTAINYNDLQLTARMTRGGDGKLQLAFTSPETLNGIVIGWDGAQMTLELGGMSLSVQPDKVPESALIKSLMRVLDATPTGGLSTEEGYVLTGQADSAAYTLVVDPETGLIRSLMVPEDGLQADFSEMTMET